MRILKFLVASRRGWHGDAPLNIVDVSAHILIEIGRTVSAVVGANGRVMRSFRLFLIGRHLKCSTLHIFIIFSVVCKGGRHSQKFFVRTVLELLFLVKIFGILHPTSGSRSGCIIRRGTICHINKYIYFY